MVSNTTCSQSFSDRLDPARARALQVALGQEPTVEEGTPLPAFFHHIYFWDVHKANLLGSDGHPALGGFLPDLGLPRRMWAGGKLEFKNPLLAGVPAAKQSVVESITQKEGRTGSLAFVRVRHEIWQYDRLAILEWQDIVYRRASTLDAQPSNPVMADEDESANEHVRFDPILLMRYSALTMNGHRIHYDHLYATQVEGYSGLVVHGPLLAQLMMQIAERQLGRPLKAVHYQAISPLQLPASAHICWRAGTAWVRGDGDLLHMKATIS